jgi:hypothetical protein
MDNIIGRVLSVSEVETVDNSVLYDLSMKNSTDGYTFKLFKGERIPVKDEKLLLFIKDGHVMEIVYDVPDHIK